MNILDENLIVPEQDRLRAWRIPCQRIGGELGWKGMKDQNDVIPLLHSMRRPTFFTRDRDYYRHALLHSGIVWFIWMLILMKWPSTPAAFCATRTSAHRRKGWAKLCACISAG